MNNRNQPKLSMPVEDIHAISRASRAGAKIEQRPVYREGDWEPRTIFNFVAYEYRVAPRQLTDADWGLPRIEFDD